MPFSLIGFSVLLSMGLYLLALVFNEWLFANTELVKGINWVYLPAGMRLLCILLFGGWGAVGLLAGAWVAGFFYYFPNPDDFVRAFLGGILTALGPYLVYRLAQLMYGLRPSLTNLTPGRLLACIVVYALASPLLHHLLFFAQGHTEGWATGLVAMIVGDLVGTLIVVYTIKGLLCLVPPRTASGN